MKQSTAKRVYRVEFKVRALAILDANDGCIYRTANQIGVPRSTLRLWRRTEDKIHQQVEETKKQRGLLLEDKFEVMIEEIANTLQEKVEKSSLMDGIRGLKMLIELNEAVKTKREAQEAQSSDVYDKLLKLMKRFDAPQELIEQGEQDIRERQLARQN